MSEKIKPKTAAALRIIRDYEVHYARQFADLLWPDSDAHQRRYNGGTGSQRGKGMWLSGGSLLAKLRKRGLIDGRKVDRGGWGGWYLTAAGRLALAEYESEGKDAKD